ncbi:MAG TPA: M15 family metallopeptidase [Psychromonas sp.]
MSLSKLQQEYTAKIAELILFAYRNGVTFTLGDAYRDPRVHGDFGSKKAYGASKSVHKKRLALDLNLFIDGEYITDGNCLEYKLLGDYWKASHELARWGGDFSSGDANHFSFEYKGYK